MQQSVLDILNTNGIRFYRGSSNICVCTVINCLSVVTHQQSGDFLGKEQLLFNITGCWENSVAYTCQMNMVSELILHTFDSVYRKVFLTPRLVSVKQCQQDGYTFRRAKMGKQGFFERYNDCCILT